jgi:hypothetical protein
VIAHRLQSALAAESAERGRQNGVRSLGKARRSKHAAPSRARRRLLPALAAAAGVAAIAVGGTVGYQVLLADQGDSGSTASTSPEPGPGESDQSDDAPAQGSDETYTITSSPQLTADGFGSEVREALQPSKAGPNTPAAPPSTKGGAQNGVAPQFEVDEATTECVEAAAVEDGAGEVMDVGRATFDGKPALLAIARSGRPGAVEAYVVTGCPGSGSVAHHDTVTVDR